MKKNVALIVAAHPGVRYVATATLYPPLDFINKAKKALEANGPAFIHLLVPCPKGWFTDPKVHGGPKQERIGNWNVGLMGV